jgi:hypothetical protein
MIHGNVNSSYLPNFNIMFISKIHEMDKPRKVFYLFCFFLSEAGSTDVIII